MNTLRKRLLKGLGLVLLITVALVPFFFVLNSLASKSKESNLDFLAFYTAGRTVRLQGPGQLYNLPLQHKIESSISPGPFLPFDHPAFEAWLFVPFSYLPYRIAYMVWAVFNLALFCSLVYLLSFSGYHLKTEVYLVWLAVSIALLIGVILLGQDTLLLAPVFLLAFLALKKHWNYAAGLVLGLGLFRFEILLPFAFIFFIRRRWRTAAGFATASAVAVLASMAMVGRTGTMDYAKLLLEMGQVGGGATNGAIAATMPSLHGAAAIILGGAVPSKLIFLLVLLGTLAVLLWAAWQFKSITEPQIPAFDLEFSLATVAALLASYYIFVHELTPLIVVAFVMLGYESARPRKGILGNRRGAALLLIFAVVYCLGGALFHFRDFSVLSIVLLGLMVWLSQELSFLRQSNPISQSNS